MIPVMMDLAVKNRISVVASRVTVYIANPFDTVAIKAIMQRGPQQNKFDFEDTQALAAKSRHIFSREYMNERAKQVGLDERALDFLRKAGLDI